eukprot:COSAG05_NODE_25696_length_192_cov_66.505263_1_plen_33_part_10
MPTTPFLSWVAAIGIKSRPIEQVAIRAGGRSCQ